MDSEEAWMRVFRETLPELYAFVSRRVGGDRATAEDVTQETWLRAVRAWRRDGIAREPSAWLQTVARRLIVNLARRERNSPAETRALDVEGAFASSDVEGRSCDDAVRLHRALASIGGSDAALLESFHFDGRSTRELAEQFRTSERAIEGRLRRARAKLRRILERVAP